MIETVECDHCDHLTGGDGFRDGYRYGGGTEYWRCCHCGREVKREYVLGPDPEHGPHAPYVRIYKES